VFGEDVIFTSDTEDICRNKKQNRKKLLLIFATPLLAVAGIVIFLITQDMSNPMIPTDQWTVLHGLILAGEIVGYLFANRKDNEQGKDGDKEHPQTARA
jgi:hypothetical protein